jgi:hypothetical protein
MIGQSRVLTLRISGSGVRFTLGCVGAVCGLLALAESYARCFPPKDMQAFLGDASPLRGNFSLDADLGVSYRSWEAFRSEHEARLHPFLPFEAPARPGPIWAFFGNSFVQAPGMLADLARELVPSRCVFNLGKNEHLVVRCAQIKLLLEHGMRPERIFIALMPVDMLSLGEQPLETIQVTPQGAMVYRPRQPAHPWAGSLVEHSRLAQIGWFRIGGHRGNPRFAKSTLYERIDEPLLTDLRTLFGSLSRIARAHDVPVTVLLIPAYHQVMFGAPLGFQDVLGALLHEQGFDVFDPRAAFLAAAEPASLFVPDKHFSRRGNELLLDELLVHVCHTDMSTDASIARTNP